MANVDDFGKVRMRSASPATTVHAQPAGDLVQEEEVVGPRVAGLIAIVVAVLAQSVAVANGSPLVLQYHLDETNPAADLNKTAADSSGNGINASSDTYNFGPVPGKFGGAMNATGNYRTTASPANDVLTSPAHLTLMAWIKQGSNPGNERYIAGRGDDDGTCSGGSYDLYTGVPGHLGLRFYIRVNTLIAGIPYALSPPPPDAAVYDGQWHMLAGTFDGATVRLYVDGIEQGTGTPVPAGAVIDYAPPGQVRSSFYMNSYTTCSQLDFPGPIDEVRLYDRALTQTELARMAAAPTGGPPPVLVPDPTGGPPSGGAPSPGGTGTNPARKKCKKKKKHHSAAAAKKKGCKKKKKHRSA